MSTELRLEVVGRLENYALVAPGRCTRTSPVPVEPIAEG